MSNYRNSEIKKLIILVNFSIEFSLVLKNTDGLKLLQ